MAQQFTITNSTPYSFTATVVRNNLGVSLSTSTLNVTQNVSGFTAVVNENTFAVNSTDTTVSILPAASSAFTSTRTDNVVSVFEKEFINVAITPNDTQVNVTKPATPITINYNPTLVDYIYEGQPVYTTSSVQFAELTLGTTSTYTFPADDGAAGQVIVTDGAGNLYWDYGGGGGGLGQWSLTTDLLTNGFNITSGSSTVALSIIAAGKTLDITTSSINLGAGTQALTLNDQGEINLQNGSARLYANNSTAGIQTNGFGSLTFTNNPVVGGDNARILVGDAYFKISDTTIDLSIQDTAGLGLSYNQITPIPHFWMEGTSSNLRSEYINIGENGSVISLDGNVEVTGILTAPTLGGSLVDVPTLRFPDGSQLSTAFIGSNTAYTTGTFILNGDMYTNGYAVRMGADSWIGNDNDVFIKRVRFDGTGTYIQADSASISLTDTPATDPKVTISASTVELNGQVVVSEIKFPDGTTQTSAIPLSAPGVQTITASTGISVTTATGLVEIANTGVTTLIGHNGLKFVNNIANILGAPTQTGDLLLGIETLPIEGGWGLDLTNLQQGTGAAYYKFEVNSGTIYNNITAGSGISITPAGQGIEISGTFASDLSSNLLTKGYNIDAETNQLQIVASKRTVFGNTLSSRISMPYNAAMRIESDFGITIDTPDDKPIQILSPFTVLHRSGASRISTDAQGQTTLNDVRIAITGTDRVIINESVIENDYINLKTTSTSASIHLGPTKAIITATEIVLATTATVQVGADLYHSKLAVQDVTNYNQTGPVGVSKGIQFGDLTVQRTAYTGGLNFGVVSAAATSLEEFILQFQTVDFGTVENPGTLAYDAGSIA